MSEKRLNRISLSSACRLSNQLIIIRFELNHQCFDDPIGNIWIFGLLRKVFFSTCIALIDFSYNINYCFRQYFKNIYLFEEIKYL